MGMDDEPYRRDYDFFGGPLYGLHPDNLSDGDPHQWEGTGDYDDSVRCALCKLAPGVSMDCTPIEPEAALTWRDDPWPLVPEPIYDWFARRLAAWRAFRKGGGAR